MAAQKAPIDIPFVQDLAAPLSAESAQVLNDLKELWKYLTGREKAAGPESWSGGSDHLQNVSCQVGVQFEIGDSDSYCFVLCARPDEAASFGTYFPLMPGAANAKDEASDSGVFSLRFITLEGPVWVYYVSSSPSKDELKTKLQLLPDWQSQWPQLLPPDKLSLDSQNGLIMWGNLPDLPGLGELQSFLGLDSLQSDVMARVTYPDGLPIVTVEMKLGDTGIGGQSLGNAYLELSSPLYYSLGSATIGLKGELQLSDPASDESYTLDVEADYPFNGDIVTVKGAFKEEKPPFIDIAQLPGGIPQRKAPSAGESHAELNAVLKFSKSEKSLKEIGLDLELDHWPLPPENPLITFEKLDAAFTVYDPLSADGKEIIASFSADAKLGKNKSIDIQCRGDYPSGQLDFFLSSTDGLKLHALIQELTDENPQDINVPDLELRELDLTYNYRNNYFSAELDVDGTWEQQGFTLEDLRFAIRGGGGELELQAAARFELGKTAFQLGAAYRSQSDAAGSKTKSWQFLGLADNIPLDKLIADLKAHFHSSTELPPALAGLHVDNLEVTFSSVSAANSGSKTDFLFDCKMKYPVADGKADMSLKIHVNKQQPKKGSPPGQKPSHTFEFTGQMTIGDYEFDVTFEKSGDDGNKASSLIAAFKPDAKLNLRDLVGKVDKEAEALVPSLEFHFRNVFFAYRKEQKESRYVFGLALDADLGLADLPLVGETLARADTIRVSDIQILYASAPISSEEVGVFNKLLPNWVQPQLPSSAKHPPGSPPTGKPAPGKEKPVLEKGFAVVAELTTAGDPVSLLTGAPPRSDGPDTGGEPTADAPPSSTTQSAPELKGDATWFDVQRSLGPIALKRVGARYADKRLWLLFSADLNLSTFTIGLQGLGIGFKVGEWDDIEPTLTGLSLGYKAGPVEISGAFEKSGDDYLGAATIKTGTYALSAIGASGQSDGETTLFVFAMLTEPPLGGPAFFYVTGLAAGFGYNRNVRIPTVDQMTQFPLVSAMMPEARDAVILTPDPTDPMKTLGQISAGGWISKAPGQNWLAVGVRFTSFEMVQSFALATVKFGTRFEVAIVGLSQLTIPAPDPASDAAAPDRIAYAEVAFSARLIPDEGILRVDGKLTPASYILVKEARLKGGFAFYVWFDGDFVISFGGYHPHFVQGHYPDVPRLGIDFQIGSSLHITAKAYFALTPSAVMAGGHLDAVWDGGPLQAWFKAGADFLLMWKPFRYEAAIYVHIGASFTLDFAFFSVSVTVELGANLTLWGPPLGGTASISYSIASFTIGFGAGKPTPPPLSWPEFRNQFLPTGKTDGLDEQTRNGALLSARVSAGLVKDLTQEKDSAATHPYSWVVNQAGVTIEVNTAVPATAATLNNSLLTQPDAHYNGQLHIGPMQENGLDYSAPLEIRVEYYNAMAADNDKPAKIYHRVTAEVVLGTSPKALWSDYDPLGQETPLSQAESSLEGTLLGVRIRPISTDPDETPSYHLKDLLFEEHEIERVAMFGHADAFSKQPLATTVNVTSAIANNGRREAVLMALQTAAIIDSAVTVDLTQLANEPGAYTAQPRSRAFHR